MQRSHWIVLVIIVTAAVLSLFVYFDPFELFKGDPCTVELVNNSGKPITNIVLVAIDCDGSFSHASVSLVPEVIERMEPGESRKLLIYGFMTKVFKMGFSVDYNNPTDSPRYTWEGEDEEFIRPGDCYQMTIDWNYEISTRLIRKKEINQ